MTVTVEFVRLGRIAHTRNFEIDDISELLDRLNSRFCEYHLIANEIDVCGEESDLYDQFMNQGTFPMLLIGAMSMRMQKTIPPFWFETFKEESL